MPSDLQRQQQDFADQLTARQMLANENDFLQGDGERLKRRMAVYRGNVAANQLNALRSAYPVIEKIVGEAFFKGLARDYGRQVPSVSGDLNEFGESMGAFLKQFPPASDLPYLPSVAGLEWLVHRAFYAANGERFDAARLARVPLDAQSHLCFRLHPAIAIMHSEFPLARLWDIHQDDFDGTVEIRANDSGGWVLVSRPRFRPQVSELRNAAAALLVALRDGSDLEAALAQAQAIESRFNLGDCLAEWIGAGVIVDFSYPGQEHARIP